MNDTPALRDYWQNGRANLQPVECVAPIIDVPILEPVKPLTESIDIPRIVSLNALADFCDGLRARGLSVKVVSGGLGQWPTVEVRNV